MEQRDYLKDQIDAVGKALGKVLVIILGLKSEGKQEQAVQLSWQTLKEEIDVELKELLNLPEESFIGGLQVSGRLSHKQLDLIANMLYEGIEGLEKEAFDVQREKLLRRLILLLKYLNETDSTYSFERHFKVEKLEGMSGRE